MPHLAQLNVAHLRHPLEHAALQPFVEALDAVNAVADSAAGFVWRWDEDEPSPDRIRLFGRDMIVNLSVWTDLGSLESYVFGPAHVSVLRQRRSFFTRMDSPHLVLWWVEEGHVPTLPEARERLDRLEAQGPTAEAFTMRQPYDSDGTPLV